MWYFVTAIIVVGLDQLSKEAVISSFQLYEMREVIPGFFNLVYVTNPGAAFSFLADVDSPWRHYFFLSVSLIAVVGLSVYYFFLRKELGRKMAGIILGFLAGGAVGNGIDRLRFGAVTDFLDFYYGSWHWPAFNLADSAICVGAVLLLWRSFFYPLNKNKIIIKEKNK